MTTQFQQIHDSIAPLRTELLNHSVYAKIDSLPALNSFMEYHIYGVWDFMSLLKVLQQRLSCVTVPWVPSDFTLGTRMVNDIVLAEESDEDGHGGYASHYHLYHRAMQKAGADTTSIDQFIEQLRAGTELQIALNSESIPTAVNRFVTRTFEIIETGNVCAIASAFAFGREDLLPDVFQRIVDELNVEAAGGLNEFLYYLERHIELDGDTHGPMAEKLVNHLCGDSAENWRMAEAAALKSLQARLELWNGIESAISQLAIDEAA